MEHEPPWHNTVAAFLAAHAPSVTADELIEAIHQRTLLLERDLPDGEQLLLIRMGCKAIEREEVFMGSVLFADWLRKGFQRAVEEQGLGSIAPITNDLEASYFLLAGRASLPKLAAAFGTWVQYHLSDLLLGDNDPERGVHGDFAAILSIPKSDFEPFPIFAVPRFLLRPLELQVRAALRAFIAKPFTRQRRIQGGKLETGVSISYRLVQSTMAFFYGRTSGGIGDSQSQNTFMARLVTEYKLISAEELAAAFRLSSDICPGPGSLTPDQARQTYKDGIDEAIKSLSFDEAQLRTLLTKVLDRFVAAIDAEFDEGDQPLPGEPYLRSWFLPYIRSSHKPISIEAGPYTQSLLHRVMLGPMPLALVPAGPGWVCRTCGDQQAEVQEKNILLGVSVGKFYNQMVNQAQAASGYRICVRCALYSYLGTKLFGATTSGKFPIPKQDNLIFHYGRHSAEQVRTLGRQLEKAIDLIKKMEERRIEEAIARQKDQERQAYDAQRELDDLTLVLEAQAAADVDHGDEDLARVAALMQTLSETDTGGVRDILQQVADCQVIDLGIGEERLIAFALPKMRDELALADKRFVRARLTVYALIGFLQEACECQGPYFFRTMPRISEEPGDNAEDHFYVQDHVVSGTEYRQRYKAAAAFAWRVTKGRGRDALTGWLGLSEELADQPLETFAQVLRDTPLHPGADRKEARYMVLSNKEGHVVFDRDLHVFDSWEYLRAYRALHELWHEAQRKGRPS